MESQTLRGVEVFSKLRAKASPRRRSAQLRGGVRAVDRKQPLALQRAPLFFAHELGKKEEAELAARKIVQRPAAAILVSPQLEKRGIAGRQHRRVNPKYSDSKQGDEMNCLGNVFPAADSSCYKPPKSSLS